MVNHIELLRVNWFSTMPLFGRHGCGFCHSYGENLANTNNINETTTNEKVGNIIKFELL